MTEYVQRQEFRRLRLRSVDETAPPYTGAAGETVCPVCGHPADVLRGAWHCDPCNVTWRFGHLAYDGASRR
jgi:ribosomal protein L37AE/L43A